MIIVILYYCEIVEIAPSICDAWLLVSISQIISSIVGSDQYIRTRNWEQLLICVMHFLRLNTYYAIQHG